MLNLVGYVGDYGFDLRSVVDYANQNEILNITLSSEGGDALTGLSIYSFLNSLQKPVHITLIGFVASAASIVAMAGRKPNSTVSMQSDSLFMIHPSATCACGTSQDIQKSLNALDGIDSVFLGIYQKATNLSEKKVKELYERESWLTAKEALELGFVTSIFEETSMTEKVTPTAIDESLLKARIAALEAELENSNTTISNLKAQIEANASAIDAVKAEKIKPFEKFLDDASKELVKGMTLDQVTAYAGSLAKASDLKQFQRSQTSVVATANKETVIASQGGFGETDRKKIDALIPKELRK